jgi:hypothetical protein
MADDFEVLRQQFAGQRDMRIDVKLLMVASPA